MGWQGYVPEEALKRWADDPTMKEHLWNYGMSRKHDGDMPDSEIMCLFGKIDFLQKEVLKIKEEMAYQETYFQNALKAFNKAFPPVEK
jgi:hypothetical protein